MRSDTYVTRLDRARRGLGQHGLKVMVVGAHDRHTRAPRGLAPSNAPPKPPPSTSTPPLAVIVLTLPLLPAVGPAYRGGGPRPALTSPSSARRSRRSRGSGVAFLAGAPNSSGDGAPEEPPCPESGPREESPSSGGVPSGSVGDVSRGELSPGESSVEVASGCSGSVGDVSPGELSASRSSLPAAAGPPSRVPSHSRG
jgi:hypothetical protein